MSTQAGPPPAGEPPAAGRPAPYAGQVTSGGGVAVNTRGVAVTDAGQKAAASLVADGVPAALAARDPGLWGPGAAEQAAARARGARSSALPASTAPPG